MTKKKQMIKIMVLLLMVSVLLPLWGSITVQAAKEETVVNVGYFLLDGFQEKSDTGECNGYAFQYYKEIAKHTGWEYNFVVDSSAVSYQKLFTGEVDMIFGVDKDNFQEGALLFSDHPVTTMQYELYARSDDDHNLLC